MFHKTETVKFMFQKIIKLDQLMFQKNKLGQLMFQEKQTRPQFTFRKPGVDATYLIFTFQQKKVSDFAERYAQMDQLDVGQIRRHVS